jgi:hypothetical protein
MTNAINRSETGASGETGVVQLDDARIEYVSTGQGPAVVLLPGGSRRCSTASGRRRQRRHWREASAPQELRLRVA